MSSGIWGWRGRVYETGSRSTWHGWRVRVLDENGRQAVLEDYLASDQLDVERLIEAVRSDERLSHAFRTAYLPVDFAPEDERRVSAVLNAPPKGRRSSEP